VLSELYAKFIELFSNFNVFFLCIGLPAQAIFFSRFVVQWHASEKKGKSIIPVALWYLSLGGSLGLAIYGLCVSEPIHFFGQVLNSGIYIRNLVLINKEKKQAISEGKEYKVPEIINEKEKICLN
jgi:lipid-A-disaccharide synthase-like uncharacterized protein